MKPYQKLFIDLALNEGALKFGEFTLKSGRVSPYFFNAGQFQTGAALSTLGRCYAQALLDAEAPFDMLFGPAYKGIPLASAVAIALNDHHQRDIAFGYNRKESKTHGEGGTLVGAPLNGRVAIIDDVITAGTAIREVLDLMATSGAQPAAIVVGLDRQERGRGELSAIQELERDTQVPVISIVNLDDIIRYLSDDGELAPLDQILQYRAKYGCLEPRRASTGGQQ